MADQKQTTEDNFDISEENLDNANIIDKAKKKTSQATVLSRDVLSPIWLSVSESAKLGGVTSKTIRRALQSQKLTYRIIKNRYQIDLRSVIKYLHTNKKLKNKLIQNGLGQYIEKWRG